MLNYTILIIEDDIDMAKLLGELAESQGFTTTICHTVSEGMHQLHHINPEIVLTDLKLPDGDGLQIVQAVKEHNHTTKVVMITGYASVQDATKAFKFGLFDLITKPFDTHLIQNLLSRLQNMIQHQTRMLQMETRLQQLEKANQEPIYNSLAMQEIMKEVQQAAPLDVSLLIYGETGVGKGVLSKYVHSIGTNPKGPYFEINCAALPENLVESELFGYEKGAFTGASNRKAGLLELANGGTLLLDEINSIRLDVQAKLLHFLQDQTIVRVGGNKAIKINVRLLFATNQPLKPLVEQGLFREDLFYRINVFPIQIPPLRCRKEDLPVLAESFVKMYAKRFNKQIYSISPKVFDALDQYDWPGNIRELENIIQRSVVLSKSDTIEISHLPSELHQYKVGSLENSSITLPEEASLAEIENLWIDHVLNACQGNKSKAAQKLGIDASTLYRKLQQKAAEN